MNIKDLSYSEKVDILKQIFDTTNIVLFAAYGAYGKITGENIYIEKDREGYNHLMDNKESDGLICINTDICTG